MTRTTGGPRPLGLAGLLAALLLGCGGGEPAQSAKPLKLKAKPSTVAPGKKGRASVTGGTKPFKFTVSDNNTGTKIHSKSGRFTAGKRAGVDTLQVTDASGATAETELTVQAPLVLTPQSSEVLPGRGLELQASGGVPPYTFTFPVGGNVSGGSLDAADGLYTAGLDNGTDTIQVSDAAGGTATATVLVEAPALVVRPTEATVDPGASQVFTASGGVPPYSFLLIDAPSGAQIDRDGRYVAGPTPATDRVRVMDDAGQTADATVRVNAYPVSLRPIRITVEPNQPVMFTADGGRPPYRFLLKENSSKGKLDPLTGRYSAGRYDGTDFVRVLDADNRKADARVKVYLAPLEVDPFEGRVTVGQSITFRALGGLPPFTWEVDGPRGGKIVPARDGRTARYLAPVEGISEDGAKARIRVKDSAEPSQASTATIDVRPLAPEGTEDPTEVVAPTSVRRGRKGPVAHLPMRQKLKNGMVVIVEENHTRPVCCISLAIAGGSAIDPPGKSGLTTMCLDLFGEGSKRLKRGEFRETLRTVGGQAWTNNMPTESFTDRATIEIEVRPAHLRLALEVLAKAFLEPAPTEEVANTIRDQWIQMAQARKSQATAVGWEALIGAAFQGHPYATPWEGTAKGLAAITFEDVEAHMALLASPARATLVVSGDIGRKDTMALVNELFGEAPPGAKPEERVKPPEEFPGPRTVTRTLPGGQAVVFVGFTVPGLMHPDRVAVELLSKVVEYQLKLDVLANLKLGDYAEANVDLFSDLGVLWCLVICDPAKTYEVEEAVLKAVATARDSAIDKTAAEREKQRLVMQEIVKRERARYRAFNLARAESAAGIRYALGVLQRIRNTTPTHIEAAAKQYLRLENLSVVRAVPEGTPEPSDTAQGRLQVAREGLQTTARFTASFAKRLYTAGAVSTIFDDRGRLAEDWSSADNRTIDVLLPNGLRMICREDRAVPLVNLGFYTAAGTAMDWRGEGGLARILWSLPWRGSVHRHGGQIHDEVLKHGFQFQQNLTPDYSAIVATGMAEHAETLAKLVGEILSVPRLDQGAYLDLWRQQVSQIAQDKQSPQIEARNAIRAALYAGHPYGYQISGDRSKLDQCSVWEAYELAWRTLRPDRTTVVAVGDRPVEELAALVEKAVGGWVPPPNVGEGEPWKIWRAHPQPGSKLTVPIKGATATEVIRAVPAPPLGHTDYPSLEMLKWMLQFRVRRDLQEQRGIVTATLVQYAAWAHGGLFEVSVTTTPEHRAEVEQRLKAHVDALRDEPIPMGEVQRIRDYIAAWEIREQQSGSNIALRLGTYVRLGAGVDYAERYFYELSRITPLSLKKVAEKYFGADAQVAVVAGATE